MDFKSASGFKKASATLSPAFDAAVRAYTVRVPKGTTHLAVAATSFAASVKIDGRPGNMASVDIRPGVGASAVAIVLESTPGVVAAEYVLTPEHADAEAADAKEVTFEKAPVPADEAAPHTHTHGGVPCTANHDDDDHGHGHSHAEEKHGHSHDGGKTECHEDHGHGHGHGHSHKEEKHGHGHSHEEEKHGHSHDGGKTECHEDHGHGHGHGHSHKEEKHGHGHSHEEEKHGHGHGH